MSPEFVKSGFKYVIPELLKDYEFHSIAKDHQLTNNPNFDNDVVRISLAIVNKREDAAAQNQLEAGKKQQAPPKTIQTFRPSLILVIKFELYYHHSIEAKLVKPIRV